MRSVVIIGGGISGLATAHFLRKAGGADVQITVLESGAHAGGKIRTAQVAGFPVDTGPDAYLSRSPALRQLVTDLGLSGEVVPPAASGAFIWSRGKLRPLPPGAAFGVPERVWPLVRSGLISPLGALRAAADVVLPSTRLPDDPTVEQVVAPRLGREVFDRMVEPLLGGVHAGTATALSAHSSVPDIEALVRSRRSLIMGMSKNRRARGPRPANPPAALVSLRGGLHRLVTALEAELGDQTIQRGAAVRAVEQLGDSFLVRTDQQAYLADELVIATPAYVSSDLLRPLDPELGELLGQINYVDVANVTVALPAADVPTLPAGTGFLVPPIEGEFIVGCTWLSAKWPHLVNPDVVLLRSMVGRAGDSRWKGMSDAELVGEVRAGLARMLAIPAELPALDMAIQRWPAAMPQYTVGHADRLAVIDHRLSKLPGLHLVGAAYRGVGLAGCVGSSKALAERITGHPAPAASAGSQGVGK